MMHIKNITVQEYLSRTNTVLYDSVRDFIDAKNIFKNKKANFNSLTFDEVSTIRKIIEQPTIERMILMYSILYSEYLMSGSVFDFFQSNKFIINEIKKINETEKKLLAQDVDDKLILAGINELNKFGILNTKISIGEQFSVSPSAVGKWKYNDVLLIQSYNLTRNKISKKIK